MKLIPLTRGQSAIVDDADFDELSKYKWCAMWAPRPRTFYAVRHSPMVGGKARKSIMMHRQLLGLTDPKIQGDHKNHNGIDNRRENIRAATRSQNNMNRRGAQRNSKTGVRGIYPHRSGYQSRIKVNGQTFHLGNFKTVPEAAAAYALANKHHFGEFGGGL